MRWVDYREMLNIAFNDDEKLAMCKNRMRNYLPQLEPYYSKEYLFRYANIVGENFEHLSGNDYNPLECAAIDIYQTTSLRDYISRFVALILSCSDCGKVKGIAELLEELLMTILDTYSIPYEVFHDQDGFFIFPKGVKEFDEELISKPLIWLSDYPETKKAWSNALNKYSNNADPSEVADDFRKALERFFQNFFDSGKTLENLKPVFGQYLKDKGVPSGVAGNLETVIQQYTSFMNNHAKHQDSVSKNVLEYIMYQTGNIIRLLITLK